MNTKLSRRRFLHAGVMAASGLVVAGPERLTAAEPFAAFQGPIIDTHTHFYDPTRREGVPWPPNDDKLLYRRVLPDDYRPLHQPQKVAGTVVVEASSWLEDNQWILDLAEKDPFIVGFVGHLIPGSPDFRADLARFAANPLFRGIRIGADAVRQGLDHSPFADDLKVLAGRDLALDLLGGPEMLPDVPRLAKSVPGLRMIIDHVANVPVTGGPVDKAWREGMLVAGGCENAFCKVSGLVEGSGRTDGKAPADVAFYQPVLDTIWTAFGADRLVYGSNWPVSERFAPCGTVQQIVGDYFGKKGASAQRKVFWSNSQVFYKWVQRG